MSITSKKDRKNMKKLLKLVIDRGLDDLYFFNSKEKFMPRKTTQFKLVDNDLATIRPSKKVTIEPKNERQNYYLRLMNDIHTHIIIATGPSGTGKTLLAVSKGAEEFQDRHFDRIVITRPAVSVDEEHGYLPGDILEKMDPWMKPITDILKTYFSPQQLEYFMKEEKIEVAPLAYMRGRTFKHSWVIADEMQNATREQVKMLLTRLGEGSKFILTGDLDQHDNGYEENGLAHFMDCLVHHGATDYIKYLEFKHEDIERHPVVKEVLTIYEK
jgi:phosphate starvation-inducible protein PhoH and related proteins